MVELIAQGKDPNQRWRQPLPSGPVSLGRTSDSSLRVSWDRKISRVHAWLNWQDGQLHVHREAKSLNPIFYQGQAREEFDVPSGGWFVIGDTAFLVVGEAGASLPPDLPLPHSEVTCSAEELRRQRYIDPDERIEVLAGLPGVIRFSPSEAELNAQVTAVLLRGIPRADNAAFVGLRLLPNTREPIIDIRHVRNRQGFPDTFRPSRRLVRTALLERRQSVLYIWQKGEANQDYTQLAGCDWAICIPLDVEEQGEEERGRAGGIAGFSPSSSRLGLYLSGTLPTAVPTETALRDAMLRSDLKFTELVADIFSALRRMGGLQRQLGQFRNFLPQAVVNAIGSKPPPEVDELLRPCVAQVTVMFCDIRGSCRIAELGQDNLLRLWDEVSAVLGIMSSSIRDEGGVIADLQGDAVMAFWGWPLRESESLEHAHRAALTICRRLAHETSSSPLGQVHCGIGIAHGDAVVGRLGTPDKFKIDAFGPTVNLASRLESLAKYFGVSIVVDRHCLQYLVGGEEGGEQTPRASPAEKLGGCVRRLAQVRPEGMNRVEEVAQLAPGSGCKPGTDTPAHGLLLPGPGDLPVLAEETARLYQVGLQAFEEGHWPQARATLELLSNDGPSRRLLEFMARYPNGPPSDWRGVLTQEVK